MSARIQHLEEDLRMMSRKIEDEVTSSIKGVARGMKENVEVMRNNVSFIGSLEAAKAARAEAVRAKKNLSEGGTKERSTLAGMV